MANKEFSWIINNKFMARKANRTAHSASLFGLSFHMWHRTRASHNILAAKCQYATCTNVLRTQSQTSAMWCRSFCKLTDRAGSCLLCLRRKLIATKLRSWSIAARLTYANVSLITASVTMRKKNDVCGDVPASRAVNNLYIVITTTVREWPLNRNIVDNNIILASIQRQRSCSVQTVPTKRICILQRKTHSHQSDYFMYGCWFFFSLPKSIINY